MYKHAKDALDVAFEVSKLLKFLSKRTAKLEKLREELTLDSPGFCMLCSTRWTVCAASLKLLFSNYIALQQLWEAVRDPTSDPTIKGESLVFNPYLTTLLSSLD
ncbi:Zinc finger MYM-type protein 1-like [Oopsacas minuta]|uniref:Zinc finger MYM-type protein 1-like n=1 Tax=Oopsacas minuta TaxID=111878 RepID=A0AAV7K2B9_9METZ|nr:Zinc finger MYM-type protein 1-like [Oopsacas minuta]